MGSKVDTKDLVSASEVAGLLGPQPVVDKSGGHIRLWLRQDIETWSRSRQSGAA